MAPRGHEVDRREGDVAHSEQRLDPVGAQAAQAFEYSLNNFCISANNMQDKGCLSCHPGWGNKTEAVNCLNCHGQQIINWEESFEDLEAFDGSDDPDEQEIAKSIRQAMADTGGKTRKRRRSAASSRSPFVCTNTLMPMSGTSANGKPMATETWTSRCLFSHRLARSIMSRGTP